MKTAGSVCFSGYLMNHRLTPRGFDKTTTERHVFNTRKHNPGINLKDMTERDIVVVGASAGGVQAPYEFCEINFRRFFRVPFSSS